MAVPSLSSTGELAYYEESTMRTLMENRMIATVMIAATLLASNVLIALSQLRQAPNPAR